MQQARVCFFIGTGLIKFSICFLYTHSFSLHKTLTYRLKLWNIMMLVSAVWTLIPTAPIRIHWWASDVMRNFFRSGLMKKPTHLYLHFMLSTSSANVFWLNYSFNETNQPWDESQHHKLSKVTVKNQFNCCALILINHWKCFPGFSHHNYVLYKCHYSPSH